MGKRVAAFRGHDRVEAVETADGTRIGGDLVVVGVGAEPRTSLAQDAGLTVDDGIIVDEYLETSAPGIYAAGDVAAAWHPVLNDSAAGRALGQRDAPGGGGGPEHAGHAEPYDRIPYFYSDQYDLGMEYAGYAPRWDRVVFRGEPAGREFVAFWLLDGRVVAGMNANVWQVNDAIEALVRHERRWSSRGSSTRRSRSTTQALMLPSATADGKRRAASQDPRVPLPLGE